jgi:hypothetical protein
MNLEIEVREPATKHTLTLVQIQKWLESTSGSPDQYAKKKKLKELLR